jgi:hypothetical protein
MSVAPVAQDDIGRCTLAQRLEPSLDLVALVGEETVLERRQIDDSSGRICQKLPGRRVRLVGARADGAEHRSVRIQTDASVDPAQNRRARSNLDVVRMSTDAKHERRSPGGASPRYFIQSSSPDHSRPPRRPYQAPRHRAFVDEVLEDLLVLQRVHGRQKPSCLNAISWSASINRWKGASTNSSPSRM